MSTPPARDLLVLAADIGGTHCRLATFRTAGAREGAPADLRATWSRTLDSDPGLDLAAAVRDVLATSGQRPAAATFGVPGPVRDGRCRTTNLPWEIDARDLARACGLGRVGLLNDLEAAAWGLPLVAPSSLVTLNEGTPAASGNRALISAGTGLGEAGLAADGARWIPFATEGSHASFAPLDDEQAALWRFLRARHDHVSWERVVSGPGLVAIHDHLRASRAAPESPALRARLDAGAGGEAITEAALAGDALATRSLELFATLFGAEAGNLALKLMATGGVFVGGGIAPRIRRWLEGPGFREAFVAKGRMRPLLEAMPVKLVLDEQLGLHGAAAHAALHASAC